jgi:hypothetical protein
LKKILNPVRKLVQKSALNKSALNKKQQETAFPPGGAS